MSHELALQKALIAHLKAATALEGLLAGRIWDAAPDAPDHPHLLIGRSESRPLGADGGGVEHVLTLTCVSRFRGTEEAKAVLAAVRTRLAEAVPETDGIRVVSQGVRFADVYPAADGLRTFAVVRVRAVTEEIGT